MCGRYGFIPGSKKDFPVSGFFEWQKTNGAKQPYFIKFKNEEMFSFAGLYDTWTDAEGKVLNTYTIITTGSNDLLTPIHNRMPVILDKTAEDKWLSIDTQSNELMQILKPFADSHLTAYPISPAVNKPENDTAEIIQPQEQIHF